MDNAPFIIERTFRVPASAVWHAITDPGAMKQWYFDLPEFRAETGCSFSFTGGPPEKVYLHLCTVTEVIPERKLTYSWRYDGYSGVSYVTFELFPEGTGTRLTLTHAGLDTFPADNPHLAAENFAAGWTDIIGSSLKEFLERT
jgi:uncharacterized protein YndB with AHSA1/START domain